VRWPIYCSNGSPPIPSEHKRQGRTVLLAGQAEDHTSTNMDSALAAAHGELHRRGLSEQRWI
jgi:hypothetical protein